MDYYKEPPSFEAELRGVSFRPIEAKAIVKDLAVGEPLLVERETDNQYDPNAIRVMHPNGEHLGFVAKEVAADIAVWMDRGWQFNCRVSLRVSASKVLLEITPVIPSDATA